MNVEEYRIYCLAKKGITEGFPFDQSTLVFKVMNKMFALAGIDNFTFINLKCDPERAVELRERYEGITPAYHMSKVHWNSIAIDSDVPDKLLYQLLDDSYAIIVFSLPKQLQQELKEL